MNKSKKKGFTITELVIVIAVIAILAAVLIPTFSNVISKSKQSAALQTCSNSLKDYMAANAEEVTDDNAFVGLVFENDGYCYVYLNSGLQYIGKMDKLTNALGDKTSATPGKQYTVTPPSVAGAGSAVTWTTAAAADLEADSSQAFYTYTVTVNGSIYSGVFLQEIVAGGENKLTNVYDGSRVYTGALTLVDDKTQVYTVAAA